MHDTQTYPSADFALHLIDDTAQVSLLRKARLSGVFLDGGDSALAIGF